LRRIFDLYDSVMKKILMIIAITFFSTPIFAQKVDSICFHLYTDSLKTGRHNYINVDGKLSNGKWQPLTSKEIQFSASAGEFEGNDLILPVGFKQEKITVKAVLKSNTSVREEKTIWIKKLPEPDRLPTKDEMLDKPKHSKRNNR